jgi:hypothetical protein
MDPATIAALEAMKAEMVASMNRTILKLNEQHARELVDMRNAALGAAAVAAHAAGGRGGARGPEIAKYNGSTPSLDTWFSSLKQQFEFHAVNTDAGQLRIAAVYLVGPALDHWQRPPGGVVPDTYAKFQAALRLRFQPVTSEETARSKLLVITQGRSTIHEYTSAFSALVAAIPDVDAATQLHLFLRGLQESTRNVIRSQLASPTLAEAMVMAVRIGTPMQSLGSSSSSSSAAMDLSMLEVEGNAPDQRLVDAVLAAMDVRAAYGGGKGGGDRRGAQGANGRNSDHERRRGPPVIKGLTEAQVVTHMNENRCFGCHEIGHGSRDCGTRRLVNGRPVWGGLPGK